MNDRATPEVAELGRSTLRGTKSFTLTSRHVDQTFLIDVAWPATLVTPGQRLPVVYVLDGNSSFGLAMQTAWMLQLGPDAIPPMLVVGVGYHVETRTELQAASLRFRDMTAGSDEAYMTMARAHDGPGRLPAEISPGGADAFLKFINDELKPFIAARFPVDETDQTLVGMSLGGLFTLHTLFNAPASFNRYVAASPSIWWNERRLFEDEAALALRVTDLPMRLFLAVGEQEEAESDTAKMVSNLYEMEARLRRRAYPGLRMSMAVFPDENHMSVFPAILSRGLREVFAP